MVFVWLLVLAQLAFGTRVLLRMLRTARGTRLDGTSTDAQEIGTISVIVPVLDEVARLGPCLDALIASGHDLREILVVDGGSTDGTQALVRRYLARDARVRLLDATPIPSDWNGKAWGLESGLRASASEARWILTIDADVVPTPGLLSAMAAHAERANLPALSIATTQLLGDWGEGLLHPAMLTTLVYRYGLPGNIATRVAEVQANGQCSLARRDVLLATNAFAIAKASRCEDVTTARALVLAGYRVGFFEAGDAVVVRMHANWRETWTNWPRSLTLRDQFSPGLTALGLAEVIAVQALPLPILVGLVAFGAQSLAAHALFDLNVVLVMMRLGVLAGTARAYRNPPWTYWLSPLVDLPVAAALLFSALRRRHTWRGRTLVLSGRSS